MKRPVWVTTIIVVQSLLALGLFGLGIYLFWLARSPETLSEKDGAEAAHGLVIAAGIFAPIAFLYLVSVLGLWRARRWGWWLGFLVNLGVTVALLYSLIDDGWANSDATDIALPLVTIALLIFYWIRGVRSYRQPSGDSRRAEAAPN